MLNKTVLRGVTVYQIKYVFVEKMDTNVQNIIRYQLGKKFKNKNMFFSSVFRVINFVQP